MGERDVHQKQFMWDTCEGSLESLENLEIKALYTFQAIRYTAGGAIRSTLAGW